MNHEQWTYILMVVLFAFTTYIAVKEGYFMTIDFINFGFGAIDGYIHVGLLTFALVVVVCYLRFLLIPRWEEIGIRP